MASMGATGPLQFDANGDIAAPMQVWNVSAQGKVEPTGMVTVAQIDAMRGASEPSFGYVQNVLADIAPEPEGDIAYLCGNPNMVDACFEALKEAGLPVAHVRREKYVSNK